MKENCTPKWKDFFDPWLFYSAAFPKLNYKIIKILIFYIKIFRLVDQFMDLVISWLCFLSYPMETTKEVVRPLQGSLFFSIIFEFIKDFMLSSKASASFSSSVRR